MSLHVSTSLQAMLRRTLSESPQRRALGFYSRQGCRWLSRRQVAARAATLAAGLRAAGLSPGDVTVLVLATGERAALSLLGVLMAGGVPLLVAPPVIQGTNSSLLEILQNVLRRTGARLVLSDKSMGKYRQTLEESHPETGFLWGTEDLPALTFPEGSESVKIAWHQPETDDVAALQLTSGTTGFPRICVWRHDSVLASLADMDTAMELADGDVCCNWTPLYHDMGLVNNFLLCMARGIPLVMLDPIEFVKHPDLWLRALSETGATITWSPNFGFALAAQRVRDDKLDGVRLDRVHSFWNAAERIHSGTMEAFERRFSRLGLARDALRTNFGCAENVGGATFSDRRGRFTVERIERRALHEQQLARPCVDGEPDESCETVVGVGRPCPGVEIHILSAAGELLPDGQVGEIAFRSASRMQGYLGDPEATARAFQGDLLVTGDMGYTRGREVFWVGRRDERIVIRGKKLDPSDLEWPLLHVAGLRAGCFAAFGIDDETTGTQQLVIVSEVRADAECPHEEIAIAVRRRLFTDLGIHAREVMLVRPGTLAKTSSGKRRHRHFRSLYLAGRLRESAVC